MATLAQTFLENRVNSKWDGWISGRLSPKFTSAEGFLSETAEVINVTSDARKIMIRLFDEKRLDIGMVLDTTKLPTKSVWVEWKEEARKTAVLFDAEAGKGLFTAFAIVGQSQSGGAGVLYSGTMPLFPISESGSSTVKIAWKITDENKIEDIEEIANTDHKLVVTAWIQTAIFCLFLMQHPKTIDVQNIEHSAKLQKKRLEKRKPALISYANVSILIGDDGAGYVKKYATEDTACHGDAGDATKRRYHRVVGHWRRVRSGAVKYIHEFYRGDPSLGVVLHRHTIRARKDAIS